MTGFSDALQATGGFYAADAMHRMLGRPIRAVVLAPDKCSIRFEFQDGAAQVFGVEGDCCSRSWIEHLTVPDDVDGAELVTVTESMMETDDHEHECLKVYSTTFRTNRGDIVVEYRNSSNGYYGGWLSDRGWQAAPGTRAEV